MRSLLKSSFIVLLLIGFLLGCSESKIQNTLSDPVYENSILEEQGYSSKEEVVDYIILYDHLPFNYLTKQEAKELGWDSASGNLWEVAEGMSIGGDVFKNREGLLPDGEDRVWIECDIDYEGGYRNGKRLVFSNDGLFYYTEDHYKTFEKIEGEQDESDY